MISKLPADWRMNLSTKGFTLFETIIAISVSIVIGTILLLIFVNSTDIFYHQNTKLQQGVDLNNSLSKVRTTIREAVSVVSSYPTGFSPEYTSSDSELVLSLLSVDSSGNLISDTYDYAVFTREHDLLRFKIFPDVQSQRKVTDQVLSKNVDGIKFNYLGEAGSEVAPPEAVKVMITLTLRQKSGLREEINVATSEANLRNN